MYIIKIKLYIYIIILYVIYILYNIIYILHTYNFTQSSQNLRIIKLTEANRKYTSACQIHFSYNYTEYVVNDNYFIIT